LGYQEQLLKSVMETLEGRFYISKENLSDMSHYNGEPINLNTLAEATGCVISEVEDADSGLPAFQIERRRD